MKIIIALCILIIFSESVHSLRAQSPSDKFKRDALSEMNQGRYGEAIVLINKYIAANPQNHEGYYLRGICYEARGQYELSVYDLRSASKLNRNDQKVLTALSRVTDVWYTQLYNKIEGHKREIAVNPNKPINYLEIGKCYKNLGNWLEAEEWYDKYLSMEEPSPDEVIRYTEILAKNNHIQKGEIILKKFVEKYPQDHRLWSRYGYFTYWLGKNKIAVEAFDEALKFRPFFKEAIDGLYLAKGKGAIYTVNDTSYRYNKKLGTFQSSKVSQYPIDRYFRILRKNTSNDSVRILLIKELIKVNRLEEAKQQLNLLDRNKADVKFIEMFENTISRKLDSIANKRVEKLKLSLTMNPNDRKSVIELANYYILKSLIDSAEIIYNDYLKLNPNDDQIRFELAKKLSWFKKFEEAKMHADKLLSRNPSNYDYQLLRGQIAVWSNKDLDLADSLLNKVLINQPNNLNALLSLANLKALTSEYLLSENYISQIEKLDPANPDLIEIKYLVSVRQKQSEEEKFENLLKSARNFLSDKKCQQAISNFKDYLKRYPENKKVMVELANAYVCDSNYSNAIHIYDLLINNKDDYDLIKQRAKLYFWSGDSIKALNEFLKLYSLNKNDVEVKLFLADSYFKVKDYNNAKSIYSELLSSSPSSVLFKNRIKWLPDEYSSDGSLSGLLSNFPNYTLFSPEYFHFNDNLNFKYNLYGLRTEIGVTPLLSLAGSFYRGSVSSSVLRRNFNSIFGTITLIPNKLFKGTFSFGQINYVNSRKQPVSEIKLNSEIKNKYSVSLYYKNNDAVQVLYSPLIIDTSLSVVDYGIEGKYFSISKIFISGYYSYKKISDENNLNQIIVRFGKDFSDDFTAGYEYGNLNFNFESPLYYSPSYFETHSIWADYNIIKDDFLDLIIGGKVGVIPKNDLILKEFSSKLNIKLFDSLTLQGQFIFNENSRETINYRSTSAGIIAFLVF